MTVIVSRTNQEAFVAGHADQGRSDRLVQVASRTAAFQWLKTHATAGDLVLLENDLPDLYEHTEGVFWTRRGAGVGRGTRA